MEALLRPLAKASLAALEDSCVLWECPLGKVLLVSDMRMGLETNKRHASKLTSDMRRGSKPTSDMRMGLETNERHASNLKSDMRSRSKLTNDIRRGSKLINDMLRGFRANKWHAQGLEANR